MEINTYLLLALVAAVLANVFQIVKLQHVREQLALIKDALDDIKCGNLNRRILAKESDMTKQICFDIN